MPIKASINTNCTAFKLSYDTDIILVFLVWQFSQHTCKQNTQSCLTEVSFSGKQPNGKVEKKINVSLVKCFTDSKLISFTLKYRYFSDITPRTEKMSS